MRLPAQMVLSKEQQQQQQDDSGAALHAAFCLEFAAFLRIGEFRRKRSDSLIGVSLGLAIALLRRDPFQCPEPHQGCLCMEELDREEERHTLTIRREVPTRKPDWPFRRPSQ